MIRSSFDLEALRATWLTHRNLRIEGFLQASMVLDLWQAIRLQPHPLRCGEGPLAFLYGECTLIPEPDCTHPTCGFARQWHREIRPFIEALTGLPLASPADERIVATLYGKGCYLDPHNDFDGRRAIAYVLGLTRDAWPPDQGGHLEFLGMNGREITVVERRPPGFNTLDLFDVSSGGPPHRVPIVTTHHERRAISGWFFQPSP